MGSKIVTTITEQIGSDSTNSNTSKPIEQHTAVPSVACTNIIEQRSILRTVKIGDNELSKPIQQINEVKFPDPELTHPDGALLEQVKIERSTEAGPDTPIEQLAFESTSDTIIQQSILQRTAARAKPLQQDPNVENSIQVTQYDFAELIFPPCNSIKNPVNTNILWRIRDHGFTFDVDSLIFKINGLEVQDTSEFSVTAVANGLQLDYNPPVDFDYGSQVTIYLDIQDTDSPPSRIIYNCSWFVTPDTKAPVVRMVSPQCGETGVDILESVVFDVLDLGNGVDLSSIRLAIEGINICNNLTFDGISVANSGTGYRGTWNHVDDPFRYGSNITVSVAANDLTDAPNGVFFVCSFDVEQSTSPEFFNLSPFPCESFVDNNTGLVFEIYGNIDGVDISTLEVRIDNKLRKVFVRPKVLRS